MFSLEQTKYELVLGRAKSWIPNFMDPDRPSLIFLDPPFSSDEYDLILEKLAILPAILKGSLIVVESPSTREIMFTEKMELLKHRQYGSVTLDILQKC